MKTNKTILPKDAKLDADGLHYTYKNRSYPYLTGEEVSTVILSNRDKEVVKSYMSALGGIGGRKSKRKLTPEQAREMVRIREEKKKKRMAKMSEGKPKTSLNV